MRYNLPIEATTLAHYYSRAYVAPITYLKRGHHDNVQSIYPNSLLLTTHYGVAGSNCYLELELTEEELNSENFKKISDDFFFYSGALPISRVTDVVFNSTEQRDMTITNVQMGNAFVNQKLIDVDSHFENVDTPNVSDTTEKNPHLQAQLKEFDRVLGALAFMRLAAENGNTYSDNFLQFAAAYSPYLLAQLKVLSIDVDCKYLPVLTSEKYSPFRNKLQGYISKDEVMDFAKAQGEFLKIDPIKGYDFKKIKDLSVKTLALLQNFSVADGEGGRDKIDDLILNGFYNRGFIDLGKAESFAFYYGYNRGYTVFRNQYKLDKKCVEVKFRFETVFEKYLVESVFESVVYGHCSADFIFLNDGKNFKSTNKGQDKYLILDKTMVVKKKQENQGVQPTILRTSSQSSGDGYSENKNLVDKRSAELLIHDLTQKKNRKEVAKLGGLPAKDQKDDHKVISYLLDMPYNRLAELYNGWKEDQQKPVAPQKTNNKVKKEHTDESQVEPTIPFNND